MQVALRHPGTGKFKLVDTGWSWSIFLGAGFFGLPLYFRGLALWGTLMLVLWFVQLTVPLVAAANGATLEWLPQETIVFGGAPIVNVLLSMQLNPPKDGVNPLLYVGILVTALGAAMVLYFKPAH